METHSSEASPGNARKSVKAAPLVCGAGYASMPDMELSSDQSLS